MPGEQLTARQTEVLAFVAARVDAGLPPTVREIAKHLGLASTNGVAQHLAALEREGYIQREPLKSRAITVLRRTA